MLFKQGSAVPCLSVSHARHQTQRITALVRFNCAQALRNAAFMTRIFDGRGCGLDTYAVTVPQANVDLFNQVHAALQSRAW